MSFSNTYRILLLLYPADFRRQFSAEMICVFEQRGREYFADKRSASFAFLLTEFSSILKGAYIMWFAKILPVKHNNVPLEPTTSGLEPLTVAEATKQRYAAISNMVTSIAKHDFSNARRYSEEEIRLKNLIQDLASDGREITTAGTHASARP
jgi:hypothetical protein